MKPIIVKNQTYVPVRILNKTKVDTSKVLDNKEVEIKIAGIFYTPAANLTAPLQVKGVSYIPVVVSPSTPSGQKPTDKIP